MKMIRFCFTLHIDAMPHFYSSISFWKGFCPWRSNVESLQSWRAFTSSFFWFSSGWHGMNAVKFKAAALHSWNYRMIKLPDSQVHLRSRRRKTPVDSWAYFIPPNTHVRRPIKITQSFMYLNIQVCLKPFFLNFFPHQNESACWT